MMPRSSHGRFDEQSHMRDYLCYIVGSGPHVHNLSPSFPHPLLRPQSNGYQTIVAESLAGLPSSPALSKGRSEEKAVCETQR